ncbi:TetR/AcrR family transcriptional regulator [Puia sp. P3]|uniref:TetR/AcrR family transcriptional regulator n=1 Tax=Puia sp. P3 TaxID=3423952 RepID=UPI003D67C220
MARKKEFDEKTLLDKAVGLFWRKGYNATSAQDLVDELGISRSSLYDTYTDKRNLFKESLRQYQLCNTSVVVRMADESADARQTVQQIFQNIIKESTEDEFNRGCFMVNTAVELSGQDKEIGELVSQNNKGVEDALTRLVKKGQADGQFSTKKTARAFARYLFSSISGLRVAARSGADRRVLNDIADVVLSTLLQGS